MRHPFESISANNFRKAFLAAIAAYAVLQLVVAVIDAPLRSTSSPAGIVSFELAGSEPAARSILASWDPTARLLASFGLGIDFAFMAAYSTAIALGTIWAGRSVLRSRWPFSAMGAVLAWGVWLAVALDIMENSSLLLQLLNGPAAALSEIAAGFAVGKFLLIAVGLAYIMYGGGAFLRRSKFWPSSSAAVG